MAKKKAKRRSPSTTKTKEVAAPVFAEQHVEKKDVVTPSPEVLRNRKLILGVLLLCLLGAIAFTVYRKVFVAAYVNGEPISRLQVIKQLEKQNGQATLSQLVSEKLIEQEAKKRSISVSKDDLNNEIKKIESTLSQRGMKLDEALKAEGMTRKQLEDQITTQVLLKKLIKPVTVSDKDVDTYINTQKDQLTEEELADQSKLRNEIKSQLAQQKQQEAMQAYVTDLQKKAKIETMVAY